MLKYSSHFSLTCISVILFTFIAGCGAPVSEPSKDTPTIAVEPEPSPAPRPDISVIPSVEDFSPDHELLPEPTTPAKSVWETLIDAQNEPASYNKHLLEASNKLLDESKVSEAVSIFQLIAFEPLQLQDLVAYELTEARIDQALSRHNSALGKLARIGQRPELTPKQKTELIQLRINSLVALGNRTRLAAELISLHSIVNSDQEKAIIGHQIWTLLQQFSIEELSSARAEAQEEITRKWYELALLLNFAEHNPEQYSVAADNWLLENPTHPAVSTLSSGLLPDQPPATSSIRSIAVLLPLTSVNSAASHAFLDGFLAQFDSDTTPLKPRVEVYDIGSEPVFVSEYQKQAISEGADFIVGPLGVNSVETIVKYGDFRVPTLLLGEASGKNLPEDVYQFALTPEHDGENVARRAILDGHTTALALYPPTRTAERIFTGFKQEFQQLGGAIIDFEVYQLNQTDYSASLEKLLNIGESSERYFNIRALLGRSFDFVPRRRQDVDFIFLIADPLHGRLIKPHIDFLKAHNVPVYSTSQIFSGQPDSANDLDLNGVKFFDMPWLIENSDSMELKKRKLESTHETPSNLERIFAMGIDVYNLISRVTILRDVPEARHHGVTSVLRMDSQRRILRDPAWAEFLDGEPNLISGHYGSKVPEVSNIMVPSKSARPEERQ